MSMCDWCSRSVSCGAQVFRATQVQAAVLAGLPPPPTFHLEVGGLQANIDRQELLALFGMDPGHQDLALALWRKQVLSDPTPWTVCPACAAEIQRHLGGGRPSLLAPAGQAPGHVPATRTTKDAVVGFGCLAGLVLAVGGGIYLALKAFDSGEAPPAEPSGSAAPANPSPLQFAPVSGGRPAAPAPPPDLAGRANHPDPAERVRVAEELGRGVQDGKAVVALLLTLAKDTDPDVRRAALRSLERFARAERATVLAGLVEALEDPDDECRDIASKGLQLTGPARPADLPVLRAALTRKALPARLYALKGLGQVALDARAALSGIRGALSSPDAEVRQAALVALGRVESQPENLVEAYLHALKDPSEAVREQAADGLGDLGPAARPAQSALAEALADENPGVRLKAVEALQKVDGGALVPALVETLRSKHQAARKDAADALGRLGPAGRGAAMALAAAVVDPGSEVRQAAGSALRKVDAGQVPGAYAEALRHESLAIRTEAALALGRMGPEARQVAGSIQQALLKEADGGVRVKLCKTHWQLEQRSGVVLRALMEALKDDEETTRAEAAEALAMLGPEARDAVGALAGALRDRHPIVRQHAVGALGAIGPAARSAVPRLAEALRDDQTCLPAATALGKIGKEAVAVLSEALDDKSARVRRHAAAALGTIGPVAADAVRSLNYLQYKDPDADVRSAAAEALRKIRPK